MLETIVARRLPEIIVAQTVRAARVVRAPEVRPGEELALVSWGDGCVERVEDEDQSGDSGYTEAWNDHPPR